MHALVTTFPGATASIEQSAGFIETGQGRRLFQQCSMPHECTGRIAVVCAPFGEERQKSYRPHFHLAQKFAEQGVACLRFDYYGTGDSAGDSREATIRSMVDDACSVVDYARSLANDAEICMVGTRLGASIAAKAAERAIGIDGIGLLSPVIEGQSYWAEVVRQQQMEALASGLDAPARAEVDCALEADGEVEIGSSRIGREFVSELLGLDLSSGTPRFGGRVFAANAIGQARVDDVLRGYEQAGCAVERYCDEERDYWTLRSMYDYYLPERLFESLASWI